MDLSVITNTFHRVSRYDLIIILVWIIKIYWKCCQYYWVCVFGQFINDLFNIGIVVLIAIIIIKLVNNSK